MATLVTQRSLIRTVTDRWAHSYRYQLANPKEDRPYIQVGTAMRTKADILSALRALNLETCPASDVDSLIGNTSWTTAQCCECGRSLCDHIEMGIDECDNPLSFCFDCIEEAARKVAEVSR